MKTLNASKVAFVTITLTLAMTVFAIAQQEPGRAHV